jgi:hypothetical protein
MTTERILTGTSLGPSRTPPGNALLVPTVTIFDGAENLRILAAASVACQLTIYVRMRRDDGTVDPMAFGFTPTSDRTVTTRDYPLGAGVLLNLVIVPTSGAPLVGECFAQASIIRGFGGATLPQGVLCQDYTTAYQPVSWPGSAPRRSTEGNGVLRSLGEHAQTGAALQVTVPAGARWKINTLTLRLNTGPCSGLPRVVNFAYVDGSTGQLRFFIWSPYPQAIGLLWNYIFVPGISPIDQTTFATVLLPGPANIILRAGDLMVMNATNLDGLETLNIDAQVEEWLEVAS